jgi:hypothetical protein
MKQDLQIGKPMKLVARWYDHATATGDRECDAEVIGWKQSQVVLRIPGYGSLRFWKRSGFEVGNAAYGLRGWKIDLEELNGTKRPSGLQVPIATDTDQ